MCVGRVQKNFVLPTPPSGPAGATKIYFFGSFRTMGQLGPSKSMTWVPKKVFFEGVP